MRFISTVINYVQNNYFKEYYGVIYLLSDFNDNRIKTKDEKLIDMDLIKQEDDLKEIVEFYHKNGKSFITEESLFNDLENGGYVCLAKKNGVIIAASCLFKNTINLHGGSKYTLCEKMQHHIRIDDRVLYSCYVIVDKALRHGGVYQQMLYYLMSQFSNDSSVNAISTITNTNNKAMMHLCGKFFDIIGLVKVRIVFGILFSRKVLYIDDKRKCWNSEYSEWIESI